MGAKKLSAGIVRYRLRHEEIEVFLVHPGGPFWAKKDAGAWSIPKGEYEPGEEPLAVAKREFQEETGFPAEGTCHPLTALKQPSGKETVMSFKLFSVAPTNVSQPSDLSVDRG